ncbi:MAG TPA: prepilin-type N-terminal cleavage/methylation domain-containing protein [Candidatus Tyrphobacter sp.]|nr:prepilin-type N-terminal cleavage/methylation domain-containing protein [Candidatus Tyrphobacter sp.]
MKPKNPKTVGGFTLIEMIIVIAIIGILAGLVLRETFVFQSSARDTRRIGDLKNTQNFLELYFNACGHYPGITDTNSPCSGGAVTSWEGSAGSLASELMSANVISGSSVLPNDPLTSQNYTYAVSSNGLSYMLGAQLENQNNVLSNNAVSPQGVTFNPSMSQCTNPATKNFYCITSQ